MQDNRERYFFCGIGGSGMMPLSLLMAGQGHAIAGSDRARDRGETPEKFKSLQKKGIALFPQDGSGLDNSTHYLVVSSAVEETVPDVKKALDLNIPVIKRGELLARCFNDAKTGIAVAGTSGKSTVTGMIATILEGLGLNPTFVNGGAIRMKKGADAISVKSGNSDFFVAEMDESDGAINHYNPSVAVLNNIALDHKSMEELEVMFGDYLSRAGQAVIVNADDPKVAALAEQKTIAPILSFGIGQGDVRAHDIVLKPQGSEFTVSCKEGEYAVCLNVPGKHNISNALAALGAGFALGLEAEKCIKALEGFYGIHRRMEMIGTKNGITVIDDFAHNPDKIAASLQTLKNFDGRLMVMFQPHGFGPLKLMGREMIEVFAQYLGSEDYLLMPEAYYAGGTVDRSVTAKELIAGIKDRLPHSHWFENRTPIADFIVERARAGDRIVIMGARDDTLHDFAKALLERF